MANNEKRDEVVLQVLDPTGTAVAKRVSLAPAPNTLEGKRIGLIWNSKPNGDVLLEEVAKLLQQRYPTSKIVNGTVFCCGPDEGTLEKIAKEVDVALVATGD